MSEPQVRLNARARAIADRRRAQSLELREAVRRVVGVWDAGWRTAVLQDEVKRLAAAYHALDDRT